MGPMRPLLLVAISTFASLLPGSYSAGNIGCGVEPRLCEPDEECFNDKALGRCLSIFGQPNEEELSTYSLDKEEKDVIKAALRSLSQSGYTWDHLFTQCLLSGLLTGFRTGQQDLDLGVCDGLQALSTDQSRALGRMVDAASEAESNENEEPSSQELIPSPSDEILESEEPALPLSDEALELAFLEQLVDEIGDDVIEDRQRRLEPQEETSGTTFFRERIMRQRRAETDDEEIDSMLDAAKEAQVEMPSEDTEVQEAVLTPPELKTLLSLVALGTEEAARKQDLSKEKRGSFREPRITNPYIYPLLSVSDIPVNPEYEDYAEALEEAANAIGSSDAGGMPETEQQLVSALQQSIDSNYGDDGSFSRGGNIYERFQREDVRKPGPPLQRLINNSKNKKNGASPATGPVKLDDMSSKHRQDIIDAACVNIEFENSLENNLDAENYVRDLEKYFGLSVGVFSNLLMLHDGHRLQFKVNPNTNGLTASMVTERMENSREDLTEMTHHSFSTTEIGCGKVTWARLTAGLQNKTVWLLCLVFVGALAFLLVSTMGFILLRRNKGLRDKIRSLNSAGVIEACQEYQDLCRARMAGKNPEKEAKPTAKEDGGSSRTSTSSWTEEPVASNMDISTGHVVLAYMEDHLKNKDRLDLEWKALCAYEAEPCSTSVAEEKSNRAKNRKPEAIPYDHSRVVLNETSNINGSSYINASSIMDHDPRNPAYIATQGPLASTAADFWQMIWEQGSQVIVMLTRTSENGREMSHCYWPEDGSEVYHIYEVHLVSEHIWCEDYLVRSFYLKNLQNSETRTVTQLHFQSWPEGGVPQSTRALLEFRRKMNKSYRGRSSPIVVHCSDGCGRAGTFILLDMVLNRMAKGAKEIDIAATLEHIRDQRPNMVSSKREFEFALTSVAEEVHAILKAMPSQQ